MKTVETSSISAAIWRDIKSQLRLEMIAAVYELHIDPTQFVSYDGNGRLVIAAANERSAAVMGLQLRDQIIRTADLISGCPVTSLAVTTAESRENGNGAQIRPPTADTPRSPLATLPDPNSNGRAKNGQDAAESGTASDGGKLQVRIVSSDPLGRFMPTPHYATRFWGAYLGAAPFALYQALRSYGYYVDRGFDDWPTIALLVDTMGRGISRATITGRAATPGRKAQIGAIDHLVDARLIYHYTEGNGRQTDHCFGLLDNLPLLAPTQVAELSERKQKEHEAFLSYFKGFNFEAWASITATTLIPDQWWQ